MDIIDSIKNRLEEQKGKKWLIGIFAFLILIVFIVILLTSSEQNVKPVAPAQFTQTLPTVTPALPIQEQKTMQEAISEAKQSAQEYDNWQADLRSDYPWLRKLPLAAAKYFVYYDLNKQSFIGRLYPLGGDNVEGMKTEITGRLKEEKGIPVEDFQFDWVVIWK